MMSPLLGENTTSKARYAVAMAQARIAYPTGSAMVEAKATANAAETEAMVPDAYMADNHFLEAPPRDFLSTDRVSTGRNRAKPDTLTGRTLARVVRPSRMPLNLIPAALPTK